MGKVAKRVAAAIAGGVMALTMGAVPAQANGAFSVYFDCDGPNRWGTTCYATAVNGVPNYTWVWFPAGYTASPSMTTTPYAATFVTCPWGQQLNFGLNVYDGAGRVAFNNILLDCGGV